MNLIEETHWGIERAKEAAHAVFAIPEAEKISESLDRCFEAYGGKQGKPEKPLTLKELRKMDGKRVYVISPKGIFEPMQMTVDLHCYTERVKDTNFFLEFSDYGPNYWLAYAHKPEGSEKL